MSETTSPADLAAQLHALADRVAALTPGAPQPAPTPVPDPAPSPAPAPGPPQVSGPQVPTGLAVTTGQDLRPVLTWDPAAGIDSWDVTDQLNPAKLVQDTVTTPRSVRSPLRPGSAARAYAVRARNSVGTSLFSVPVVVPAVPASGATPTPTPAPAPTGGGAAFPFDPIGGDWYLTLPTGKPGAPDTVKLPELAGYSSSSFRLNDTRDGAVFTAPCGGVTTKNSTYPRSELRQMNGTALASWDNAGPGQTLTVEEAFTALPVAKPEVVGAQIHDAQSDVIEVMLSGKRLLVRYNNGKQSVTLDDNYVLGTRYRLQIIAANKAIRVLYNDTEKANLPITGSGWYWKVGSYVQSNVTKGDRPDAVGQVVVFAATVTHA